MLEATEQFKVTGQLRQHRSGSHGQGAAPAPAAVTWRLDNDTLWDQLGLPPPGNYSNTHRIHGTGIFPYI